MPLFERRAYQVKASKEAYESSASSLLVVAPGGSGKTVIAAQITRRARRDRKKVLIVSHRREIIHQTVGVLRARGERPSVIMGDETSERVNSTVVASIDTLTRRKWYPAADVVIVDEAHRAAAASYARLIDHYKQEGAKVIGLSATPYRLDGRSLLPVFEEMYEAAKPSELLGKYIMKPRVFSAPPEHLPDLVGLRTAGGDFRIDDLVRLVNKKGLIASIVSTAKKHLQGRLAVAFCCSIPHSRRVAAELNEAGIAARHLDGGASPKERDELLNDLRKKRIRVATCCMVLSEGWDLPECGAVIMARPTRSLSLYIQMANRCVRMGSRRPLILDHACNTVMHGFSWTDREWSLKGRALSDPKAAPLLKVCPLCGCVNHLGVTVCEVCGGEMKVKRIISPKERRELELAEWSKREKGLRRKKILEFAEEKGLGKDWVEKVDELWAV